MHSDETARNHPAPASADHRAPAPAQRTALRAGADPARAQSRLNAIQALVDEQACDESLWCIPVYLSEKVLQDALRRLHEAIEGKSRTQCAIDALRSA